MIPNEYRERWAQWLPQALQALAKDPPDYASVMPHMPLPAPAPMPFACVLGPLCIALVSSSGAYDARSQAPFAASAIAGDPTHRVLDIDIPTEHLEFAPEHFNHAPAKQDWECIIPRETIRSLGAQLTSHLISWTEFLLDWPTFIEATVPQIYQTGESLRRERGRARSDMTDVPQDGRSGRQRIGSSGAILGFTCYSDDSVRPPVRVSLRVNIASAFACRPPVNPAATPSTPPRRRNRAKERTETGHLCFG